MKKIKGGIYGDKNIYKHINLLKYYPTIEQQELSYITGRGLNWYNLSGKFTVSIKDEHIHVRNIIIKYIASINECFWPPKDMYRSGVFVGALLFFFFFEGGQESLFYWLGVGSAVETLWV